MSRNNIKIQNRRNDEKRGGALENRAFKELKKKYPALKKFKNKFNRLDFIDRDTKTVFEVKSASFNYRNLKSYMFGIEKFLYFKDRYSSRGYKFVLVYSIFDNLAVCQIDTLDNLRTKNHSRNNGLYLEKSIKYAFVSRSSFTKFEYQYLKKWSIDELKEPDYTNVFNQFLDEE